MPKRSLEARRLTFRKRRDTSDNPEVYSPADLHGENLLDIFESWLQKPDAVPHMDASSDDCVVIKKVSRPYPNVLFIDTNSGRRGESGEVYSPSGLQSLHHITEEEAATGHTRALLYVPDRGRNAIFFSEYCQRGTAGTRIIKLFFKWFYKERPSILCSSEAVLESETWLENITAVKSIEMRAHRLPNNSYDRLRTTVGSFNLELKPGRGRSFSKDVLAKLKSPESSSLLGIPELEGEGETKFLATVIGQDNREKKIDLNDEVMPHFRKTLSENHEPEMPDHDFIVSCIQHAEDILVRLGE